MPHEYDEEAIPGEAGVDFPNYDEVPDTSFTCNAQEHPGLYADTEAQCQVSARLEGWWGEITLTKMRNVRVAMSTKMRSARIVLRNG